MELLLESRALWGSLLVLMLLPLVRWSWALVLCCALLALSMLATLAHLLVSYFTGQGITDAVLYHLNMVLIPELALQFWYLWLGGLGALLALVIGLFTWGRYSARVRFSRLTNTGAVLVTATSLLLACVSVVMHPAVGDLFNVVYKRYQLRGEDLLAQRLKEQVLTIEPVAPRSFVYLYLESFERIFLDQKRFPDLTPNLNRLFEQGTRVGKIYTAPMTGWTMAGMVSSQCGVPLSTAASVVNPVSGGRQLTCLGDILSQEQYYLTYMGGATAKFAKKGRFYSSHGFDEVYGTEELEALAGTPLPQSSWGVYDDDLLALAFDKFEALAREHERFGLVLLTLDTHQPAGHRTPSCRGLTYGDGQSGMLNAARCTDVLVSQFIEKFFASPYSNDVVLIVGSDHLLMGNDAGIEEETATRENLFYLFNVDEDSIIGRQATKFDLAPTILHALGFRISELNFGRNLFEDGPTLSEFYGRDEFNRLLYVWRNHLEQQWNEQDINK